MFEVDRQNLMYGWNAPSASFIFCVWPAKSAADSRVIHRQIDQLSTISRISASFPDLPVEIMCITIK